MNVHSFIFDLDGTLIDSAPSILASMKVAFDEAGIQPARPLTHELIGPPLAQTLTSLLTEATFGALPGLIEGFKRHYDESGYRETRFYEGVPAMLSELRRMQLRLYVATNKRILPTRKIVEHFGWTSLFEELYALDYFVPAVPNKTAMLQRLHQTLPGAAHGALYVGDRAEDAEAAHISRLPFLWAAWGYGGPALVSGRHVRIDKPEQLLGALQVGPVHADE